jgi:hypothetical protein
MLGEKDMNDKDLRVIKTKKALTSSLYALLEIEYQHFHKFYEL